MTDCPKTLGAIMRDPAELAQAQADIATAWCASLHQPEPEPQPVKSPAPRIDVATIKGIECPAVRRVLLVTAEDWS